MKNLKTTLSGVVTILGGVATFFLSKDVPVAVTAITAGIGLICARDKAKKVVPTTPPEVKK